MLFQQYICSLYRYGGYNEAYIWYSDSFEGDDRHHHQYSSESDRMNCNISDKIMYVKTFKTDVIFFIGKVVLCLTSHWPIIFSIKVNSLILKISLGEIKGKMSKLPINVHKNSFPSFLCSWFGTKVVLRNRKFVQYTFPVDMLTLLWIIWLPLSCWQY